MGITPTKSRTLTSIKPESLEMVRVNCKFLLQLIHDKTSDHRNTDTKSTGSDQDLELMNQLVHLTYSTVKHYSSKAFQSTQVVHRLEDLQVNIVRLKFEESQLLLKFGGLFYDQMCELFVLITNIKTDILEEQLDYCGEEGMPFVKRALQLSKGESVDQSQALPYEVPGKQFGQSMLTVRTIKDYKEDIQPSLYDIKTPTAQKKDNKQKGIVKNQGNQSSKLNGIDEEDEDEEKGIIPKEHISIKQVEEYSFAGRMDNKEVESNTKKKDNTESPKPAFQQATSIILEYDNTHDNQNGVEEELRISGMGNKLEWPQRYLFITERDCKFDWADDKNDKYVPLALDMTKKKTTNFLGSYGDQSRDEVEYSDVNKIKFKQTSYIEPLNPNLYLVTGGTKTMIVPASGVKGSFLIVHSCPTILPIRLRKCENDDYNNSTKGKVSQNKQIGHQTTQIYEYVNFKQVAYLTFEFQIHDCIFANGFYFFMAIDKNIYCREFDSDSSQPKYFCSYNQGNQISEYWLEYMDKKAIMSTTMSASNFSSFSKSSTRSQNKNGIQKRNGLNKNSFYENQYEPQMRHGDGREYIVIKELYNGVLMMRYCFLRNCKYKYVHLGDFGTCGKNFEILGQDMMVYDSQTELKLFYYTKFNSKQSKALSLQIYTDNIKHWRVKEMTKCLKDTYLLILTESLKKNTFCICVLKATGEKLDQLAFCKVQITGEDSQIRFSKLTVVGCEDESITMSLISNFGDVRFFKFDLQTKQLNILGMGSGNVNRDWKNQQGSIINPSVVEDITSGMSMKGISNFWIRDLCKIADYYVLIDGQGAVLCMKLAKEV